MNRLIGPASEYTRSFPSSIPSLIAEVDHSQPVVLRCAAVPFSFFENEQRTSIRSSIETSYIRRHMDMAFASRRPLPAPPVSTQGVYEYAELQRSPMSSADMYSLGSPYYSIPFPYFPFSSRRAQEGDEAPTRSILSGGTLLHKGFYDLLALATPSRLFAVATPSALAAGPRYEHIEPGSPPAVVMSAAEARKLNIPTPPPVTPLRKNRRISKDMVSSPTGFVYVGSSHG